MFTFIVLDGDADLPQHLLVDLADCCSQRPNCGRGVEIKDRHKVLVLEVAFRLQTAAGHQGVGNSNQPRLPANLHDADRPKLRVFENFYMVHVVPPCIMFWASKKRLLPAACVHIVIYLSCVVVVHGGGDVEQHGQQILLHVADFGGVIV